MIWIDSKRSSWLGGGCVVALLALALVTVGIAILAWSSTTTLILAAILVLGGLGLAVMAWAEWGRARTNDGRQRISPPASPCAVDPDDRA